MAKTEMLASYNKRQDTLEFCNFLSGEIQAWLPYEKCASDNWGCVTRAVAKKMRIAPRCLVIYPAPIADQGSEAREVWKAKPSTGMTARALMQQDPAPRSPVLYSEPISSSLIIKLL